MVSDSQRKLEQRVVRAAEASLAEQRYVAAVDVLMGIGWLSPQVVDRWRQGRVEYLERDVQADCAGSPGRWPGPAAGPSTVA